MIKVINYCIGLYDTMTNKKGNEKIEEIRKRIKVWNKETHWHKKVYDIVEIKKDNNIYFYDKLCKEVYYKFILDYEE